MLQIFFSSFVIILLFSPFGIFFSNGEKSISSFSSQLIYSFIVISFIALFLNFFIPLSLYVNSFLILFALYFIFKDWNLYFEYPLKPVHLNSRIFGNSNAACLHEIQYVCQYMCTCVSYLFVHLNSRIFGNSNVLFNFVGKHYWNSRCILL